VDECKPLPKGTVHFGTDVTDVIDPDSSSPSLLAGAYTRSLFGST